MNSRDPEPSLCFCAPKKTPVDTLSPLQQKLDPRSLKLPQTMLYQLWYSCLYPKHIYSRICNSYVGSMRSVPKNFRMRLPPPRHNHMVIGGPSYLTSQQARILWSYPKRLIAPNTPIEVIKRLGSICQYPKIERPQNIIFDFHQQNWLALCQL